MDKSERATGTTPGHRDSRYPIFGRRGEVVFVSAPVDRDGGAQAESDVTDAEMEAFTAQEEALAARAAARLAARARTAPEPTCAICDEDAAGDLWRSVCGVCWVNSTLDGVHEVEEIPEALQPAARRAIAWVCGGDRP